FRPSSPPPDAYVLLNVRRPGKVLLLCRAPPRLVQIPDRRRLWPARGQARIGGHGTARGEGGGAVLLPLHRPRPERRRPLGARGADEGDGGAPRTHLRGALAPPLRARQVEHPAGAGPRERRGAGVRVPRAVV